MRKRLKLSFDRLEDTLTLVSPLEASSVLGGYSEGSGLPPDASIEDILGYYSGLGFTFSQDENGNYSMTGGGSYSGPGIKIDPVTVMGEGYDPNKDKGNNYGSAMQAMLDRFLDERGGSDTGQDNGSTGSDGSTVPDNAYEGPWGGTGGVTPPISDANLTKLIKEMSDLIYAKLQTDPDGIGEFVANLIGGELLSKYNENPTAYKNTCAISLSYVLNKVFGDDFIPDRGDKTLNGDSNDNGTNENYFFRAVDVFDFLKTKFGNQGNHREINSASDITGQNGFILYLNADSGNGLFNHVDIWNGTSGGSTDYTGQDASGRLKMYFIKL